MLLWDTEKYKRDSAAEKDEILPGRLVGAVLRDTNERETMVVGMYMANRQDARAHED